MPRPGLQQTRAVQRVKQSVVQWSALGEDARRIACGDLDGAASAVQPEIARVRFDDAGDISEHIVALRRDGDEMTMLRLPS